MEVREALQKRRSIRKYTEDAVSKEQLDELLHAAMSGPSACNRTPWDFYVVTDPEVLKKLREAAKFSKITAPAAHCGMWKFVKGTSDAVRFLLDSGLQCCNRKYSACATELGLGSLWCGVHPQKHAEKRIADILGLTNKQIPLNIVYIGHPAEEPEPRDQYKEKNVHWI